MQKFLHYLVQLNNPIGQSVFESELENLTENLVDHLGFNTVEGELERYTHGTIISYAALDIVSKLTHSLIQGPLSLNQGELSNPMISKLSITLIVAENHLSNDSMTLGSKTLHNHKFL